LPTDTYGPDGSDNSIEAEIVILSLSLHGAAKREGAGPLVVVEWQGLLSLNFDVADSKAPIGADLLGIDRWRPRCM
jgi:hypothetical protein